ncbi:uncharacterized protein YfaP (DUF2135 family) [Burkholderia ambifaria]|nr:uncharacterized protein YfaP (DUF2135 family) [Burkholderia ambifaria]
MEKAKPEGKIRNHDGPVGGWNKCDSNAHSMAARLRMPAGGVR